MNARSILALNRSQNRSTMRRTRCRWDDAPIPCNLLDVVTHGPSADFVDPILPPPPPKTPCNRLSKDKVFTDWAKGLWNVARSSTPWLETGGLFGHKETTAGTSVTATYDRLNLPTSLPYWNGWMSDTLADTKDSIHWEYMVHTHPVSGSTEISGITAPSIGRCSWSFAMR